MHRYVNTTRVYLILLQKRRTFIHIIIDQHFKIILFCLFLFNEKISIFLLRWWSLTLRWALFKRIIPHSKSFLKNYSKNNCVIFLFFQFQQKSLFVFCIISKNINFLSGTVFTKVSLLKERREKNKKNFYVVLWSSFFHLYHQQCLLQKTISCSLSAQKFADNNFGIKTRRLPF